MQQKCVFVMIVHFGGGPLEVWVRPRGFESPLVHLLGLVYDACCLLAFVVLLGRRYGICYARQPTQANLTSCLPNVAQFNSGKIDALAWVESWRTH